MLELEPIQKLTKDLKQASYILSATEARFLVDAYYQMQDNRIRADGQVRSMSQDGEPHAVLQWLADQNTNLENQVKKALDAYSGAHPVGEWARSQKGIGPVIAAGLLAHIDIRKCPTAGHIWRFAGLDPTVEWKKSADIDAMVKEAAKSADTPFDLVAKVAPLLNRKAENIWAMAESFATDRETGEMSAPKMADVTRALKTRPFNATLKTLCWKVGESFVKVSGDDEAFYGRLYRTRKEQESIRNEAGEFKQQAVDKLEKFNIGKGTDAYKAYSAGKLPLAHIHARAKRYAVKIFLSSLHLVWYHAEFGVLPPKPFAIEHLGHAHIIKPPGYETMPDLRKALEAWV